MFKCDENHLPYERFVFAISSYDDTNNFCTR